MAEYQDVIMAGFGGQGVMLIGNLLAQAGMEQGLEVSFIPVYGAEMRGGTANCTVVLDTHPIGSPWCASRFRPSCSTSRRCVNFSPACGRRACRSSMPR